MKNAENAFFCDLFCSHKMGGTSEPQNANKRRKKMKRLLCLAFFKFKFDPEKCIVLIKDFYFTLRCTFDHLYIGMMRF